MILNMHCKRITGLSAILLLAISHNAVAFDLHEAWLAARTHSASYHAARHARDAAQEPQEQAKAKLLPNLGASASYNYRPQAGDDNYRDYGWKVQVSQPLFNRQAWNQYEAEQITAQLAESRFTATESELLFNVSKAYLDILAAKEKLIAVESEKAAYEAQIIRAKALFDAGEATIIDTYEAQSGLDAATARQVTLETDLVVAQNQLANLTGLNPMLVEPVNLVLPDFLAGTTEQEWIALAEENSAELKVKQLEVSKSLADVETAESQHWPQFSLTAGYQDNHNVRHGANPMHDRNKGAFVGIEFTIPIYTGGETTSRVRQNEAISAQKQSELAAETGTLHLQVRQLLATIRGQQAEIRARQRLLDANEEKLGATRLGRQVGVRNNMDEIQAEQERAAAAEQLAEACYGYVQAWLQLLQISGELHRDRGIATVKSFFVE